VNTIIAENKTRNEVKHTSPIKKIWL